MATYISGASASLNAAGTWRTIEAQATAQNFTGTAAIAVPTTPGTGSDSPTWTGTSTVVDGILLQLATMGTVTGNLTVALYRTNGTPAEVAAVTVALADLPVSADGWQLFKFASNFTQVATDTYCVRVYRSAAGSSISLMATTATTSWNRALRTTSNPGAAPVAADVLFVCGEFTGIGAKTARSVTVDINTTTAYGNIWVGSGGTLAYGVTAATTYNLRLAGNLYVSGGGTLTMGTPGTPMPSNSLAVLEFACASDGQYGLLGQGTFTIQGASKTYDRAFLAADASVGATSITTDVSTGWANGDTIIISATDRTGATLQSELRTISSIAGTSIGVSALTYAHDGTSPTQARLIHLTRNVKIRSTSATMMTFVNPKARSIVDIDWAEFYYLGENVAGRRGVELETTTGSASINRCSIWGCEDFGLYYGTVGTANNIAITNNVMWALGTVTGPGITCYQSILTAFQIDGNISISSVSTQTNWTALHFQGTFNGNEIIGGGRGLVINDGQTSHGTVNGLVIHSTYLEGLQFVTSAPRNLTIQNLSIWRCLVGGINITVPVKNMSLIDAVFFGNVANIVAAISTSSSSVDFFGCDFNGDATYASVGILAQNCYSLDKWRFISCDFSTPAGAGGNARVACTSDISFGASGYSVVDFLLVNTKLGGTAQITGLAYLGKGSSIRAQRLGQVAGAHKSWMREGQLEPDATTYRTSAPALKMSPAYAGEKLESEGRLAPIRAGTYRTVSAWVRKDGTYNGAQPRLVLRRNDGAGSGFVQDIVLDTMAGASGQWEQLQGSTPVADDNTAIEVFVDCDGTAGAVFVDDWAVSGI